MLYITIFFAKLTFSIIKLLGIGSGYTWPGYIARLLSPSILNDYTKKFSTKYIFVTGTNGKTTTSKLITHILTKESYTVISNKSGANLLNGIVSALILDSNLFSNKQPDYCVIEVDELTLPELLKYIEPKILVLLNLSRDQLDRYGEVDSILEKWIPAIKPLKNMMLVLDRNQREFDQIPTIYTGHVFYFDSELENLGKTNLMGDYNAKNLNAALLVCGALGIGKERCFHALADFSVAFGRGEVIDFKKNNFRLFLAKNPSSFNNNLDLLVSGDVVYDSLLIVLNDEVRDGRDVSWIYDISSEKLGAACLSKNVYVSGLRAYDMATRLQYANVALPTVKVIPDLKQALEDVVDSPATHEIAVLPNYSAMLEMRKLLTGKEIL